ncbi:hypothetical protein WH91_05330 [Devosia psychrophila]|nr:hypothetical protein WH91_05330 [Devosia psychrophila]
MTDPKRIRMLMQNALARNEEGLARLCLRRIFELGGEGHPDPLVRRLWQAVTAYEETLKMKVGRAQRETKVRKKIETKGPLVALADWATAKDVTPGFLAAIGAGMAEFTGEYIVLEYADSFEDNVVQAARARLEGFGVALPKTWRSRLT